MSSAPRLRVLHAIHDFLPRHRAGSEIYALELGRELIRRHVVTVLAAEYDPSRPHGHVAWRVQDGVPVVELVNNWIGRTFEDTYRSPFITEQLTHLLDATQPDVVHVHSLLNLSFDLPALVHARGVPVVATLHDYTLVCPSGGQRLHRAEDHLCETIDPSRCARCFRESPFSAQTGVGNLTNRAGVGRFVRHTAAVLRRRLPAVVSGLARVAARSAGPPVFASDIVRRLDRARDVLDEVDLFVAPSRAIADEFERLGLSRSKLRVLPYGVAPLGTVPRQAGDGRWYWSSENFPASEISLRTAAPENVVIIDTTPDRPRVIGEVDLFSAQVLVHEQAIYLHESVQYHVDKLDWPERKAYVRRVDADYYTYANRAVTLKPLDVFADEPRSGGRRVHGEVMVASLVTLFKKLKFGTDENVGWGPIDLHELELQTTAAWLVVDPNAASGGPPGRWRRNELDVALLGAGRAIQTVASVLLMVDPRDLGLVTQVRSPHEEAPTIYLYEAVPGGVGQGKLVP